jgi:glucosamine--fructose-6-phosphate aminotransferase (isomerizing)
VVCTPELEKSWCHTASYTCAVAAIAALRGEDVSGLADAVSAALSFAEPVPSQTKILVAGAGRDWPTAQEAVLKLREGAWISAGAHQTEQLLHGHLAAIDETVRAYVLEGEGRAGERARDAAAALRELGCETTLVQTQHPVVDIVRFHLLTLALAESKGIDPDAIHRDDPRWARARAAHP